jgi:hypothetical protein
VIGLLGRRAKTKLVVYLSVVLWLALAGLLLVAGAARADAVPPPPLLPHLPTPSSASPSTVPHSDGAKGGGSSNGDDRAVVLVAVGLAVVLLASGSWLALLRIAASHAVREPAARTPPVEGTAAKHPETADPKPGEDER